MGHITIPELNELEFQNDGHKYILNGSDIPSVTNIMTPLSSFEYGEIDEKTMTAAAERGTAVHNAIENWIKFGFDDLDEEYHGYLDGFIDWWEKVKPDPVGSEIRIYHKLMRYGGTIDLLAMIEGKLNLIDFKTTSRLIEKNCRVQLEAYAMALESHGIVVAEKRILHLAKNGKWKNPRFQTRDAEAWRVFGAAKYLYDFERS